MPVSLVKDLLSVSRAAKEMEAEEYDRLEKKIKTSKR
tara:strand:- start:16350 stop:16460 length:111 start_codon:yes stop_codon:yes gene_type:complete